jgi:alpha-glucosidase
MSYDFVNVNEFTPNTAGWAAIGRIVSHSRNGNTFTLRMVSPGMALQVSFLSATCFRVLFNPNPNPDYSTDRSWAVIDRNLAPVTLHIVQDDDQALVVDGGAMQVEIALQPYAISVYRNGQLISKDYPGQGLVYIPGQQVIANFKVYPANARYCGFGEKAGAQLLKNNFTMT